MIEMNKSSQKEVLFKKKNFLEQLTIVLIQFGLFFKFYPFNGENNNILKQNCSYVPRFSSQLRIA